MPKTPFSTKQHPSLKDDVLHIDREILRLLLRRFNLLVRMRGNRSHVLASEEKELREAWTKEAMRVSSDPKLTQEMFQLLETITFHAKPAESNTDTKARRPGFNLAPSLKPVSIAMHMPASSWHVHAWILLAACLGEEVHFDHVLMHDPQHDFIRAMADAGISVTTRNDSIFLSGDRKFSCPDLSIHCGNDPFLFGLFAGQYLVRPSRVRFTAEKDLAQRDLVAIAHFLPSLGARLSSSRSQALRFPIRLECSGVLPKTLVVPGDVPASFVCGLIVALPFAEAPVTIDLSQHNEAPAIIDRCLDLLQEGGFGAAEIGNSCLTVNPSSPSFSDTPSVPCDPIVAAYILAFPLLTGGKLSASGMKPKDPLFQTVLAYYSDLGLSLSWNEHSGKLKAEGPKKPDRAPDVETPEALLTGPYSPLVAALHAFYAMKGHPLQGVCPSSTEHRHFYDLFGLTPDENGFLGEPKETDDVLWVAPTPEWAMALAMAAFGRKKEGFKLGNSGIITEIWPKFWTLYNALPEVDLEREAPAEQIQKNPRRRIRTDVNAKIPPQKDPDDTI